MPTFDPENPRICVRIVYDGAAFGGKTTNLTQLCNLFSTHQGSELYTPLALRGRTMYFDWVQIRAGVACGYPLICQVVAVPGQVVLTPRRRHLLSTADVVVYVCDSARSLLSRAQIGFELLAQIEHDRGGPLPIVVQANKQDQVDAVSGAEVVRALGRDLPLVEAIAADGVGVVDTFVRAVGAAVAAMQEQADRNALRLPLRPLDTKERLLAGLCGEAIEPEWAAEMLLEEASDAFLLERARDAEQVERPRMLVDAKGPRGSLRIGQQSPPLPTPDVPTGFVWPAQSGRAHLALVMATKPSLPLVDSKTGTFKQTVLDCSLTTSIALKFQTGEAARQALVGAARAQTQLESLSVPDTVLVVQEGIDGAYWLWRVAPNVATFAELLDKRALAAGEIYAEAAVAVLRVALRHALPLCPRLDALGLQRGVPRYVANTLQGGTVRDALTDGLRTGLSDLRDAGIDLRRVVETLLFEARRQLDLTALRAHGLSPLADVIDHGALDVHRLCAALGEPSVETSSAAH